MLTKICSTCKVEKIIDDYYKQKSGKYGVKSVCKFCCHQYRVQVYKDNKDGAIEYSHKYYNANKDKLQEQGRIRYHNNSAALLEYQRTYRKNNPHIINAIKAKRRVTKKNGTPAWADLLAVKGLYQLAAIFNSTGINLQVDHIVPLQSDRVCGLHCEANLQLLSASDNIKKSNRHWPDMW